MNNDFISNFIFKNIFFIYICLVFVQNDISKKKIYFQKLSSNCTKTENLAEGYKKKTSQLLAIRLN